MEPESANGKEEYVIPLPESVEVISDLNHLRIGDLKAVLKEKSLKVSGRKSELQQRLFEAIMTEE